MLLLKLPLLLSAENGRLVQRPLPEMKLLRTDALWQHVRPPSSYRTKHCPQAEQT